MPGFSGDRVQAIRLRDADGGCADRRVRRSEFEPVALEPVDALTVRVLVDNVTDILLVDEGRARRPAIGAEPRVPAPILDAS